MKIYGVSGTNGAGKDSIAEMLAERHGFFVASATDLLAAGLREKGWPIDREHKSKLSAEWRRQYGMSAVVDRAWEQYQKVKDQYQGFVVGSLRHPGEGYRIHELGGQVIWVDAEPRTRYDRISAANRGVDKASEDSKTFEEFMADQEREMHHSGDAATLNISDVKAQADILLGNSSNSVETFKDDAEKALGF
ncbi:MAG: AAA family ATPase [Candidatus Saccharibacteria bacterium]